MVSFTLIALVTAAAAALYFWLKHQFSYWRRKGVPYIEPTLVLGNTTESFMLKNNFGLYLSKVYNDPRMVDEAAVGIYSLNKPGLVIRDPELLKCVLIKNFNKFYNRFGRSDPHGDSLGSNNLFFVRNPHWKDIRSKISPVFTSGKIKQMYPLMLEVAEELEIHLAALHKDKKTFVTEVKEICELFTTDLIANIAFGLRANSLRNPNAEFRSQGRKMFLFTLSRSFHFFIAFFMPTWVSFFRIKIFSDEFSSFLRSTITYVINERERTGAVRNDLIDILVTLKKEAASQPDGYFAKDHDFLVAQAAVFLTAGFETSSSTMSFTLYEMAKHPDMQDRLRREIHEALVEGEGTITYDKIMSLEYLGMVVDEVLRMYPVLPFLDREHVKPKGDTPFSLKPFYDYTLEDEMPVFIPIFAIQRDPKYWPNPDKFDPERFSPENKKNINPITYMPFGTGPHNCIGSRIGLLQSKIGLVHILKNYYVTTCKETISEMKFDPKAFLLQCADGISLNFVKDKLYDKIVET